MSTDIVERLRAHGGELAAEAAAEIKRLRDALAHSEIELAATLGTFKPAAREADDTFRVTEQPANTPR